jgi:hypothetical protein
LVGLITARIRIPFRFLDQSLSLAHVGISRLPGQLDPKVFVIQKFKKTGRERVNISNSFTCHCSLILCSFEFSLVLNENNLETLSFVLPVNGYVHSLEMV